MRLKLILQHPPGAAIPINYAYFISAWIYRTLEKANPVFANWLHENGFDYGGKKYKLFCFGPLLPQRYEVDKKNGTFILSQGPTRLDLSFFVDKALEHFVIGLFQNQHFSLGDGRFSVNFEVVALETLPRQSFQPTMTFRLLTPLCISHDVASEKHPQYLSPEAANYGALFSQNLIRKQRAKQGISAGPSDHTLEEPFGFKLLSSPRPKLFRLKDIEVKAYLFDFELTAPVELMELGYYAGFGEKNSGLGMGMGVVFKNPLN
ncbi:MAG: CRISPR-associated endoribonuclease Cas6 [Saprospiraceae bacterium]